MRRFATAICAITLFAALINTIWAMTIYSAYTAYAEQEYTEETVHGNVQNNVQKNVQKNAQETTQKNTQEPTQEYAKEYTLEDLYQLALKQSESIRISEQNLAIAEKGKDKSMAALLPVLSAFGSYTRYSEDKYSSTDILLQPENSLAWGVRLDQSFTLNGREITALEASKKNIVKSRFDHHAVIESLLIDVSVAYYNVLRAKKTLDIYRANVERLTKHRDAAKARLAAGEGIKTDLFRLEAELSGAQAELVKAENDLILTKLLLAKIVGTGEDGEVIDVSEEKQNAVSGSAEKQNAVSGEEVKTGVEVKSLATLKQTALAERAELKSSRLQIKIAEDQVKYAKGAYWPTLSIEGVYAKRDETPDSGMLNKESMYGTLKLSFPLFEGGLRKADLGEVEAKWKQVELTDKDLIKAIYREVESAYLDFTTQKSILKSLEDQVSFGRENHNLVAKRYEQGLANSIDVADANLLLLTAEKQLADAKLNYQLSLLKLRKATGTLTKTAGITR